MVDEAASVKARQMMARKRAAEASSKKMRVSPFVKDSAASRLNLIEIEIFMSDYRSAYHLAHQFLLDFKEADGANLTNISLRDTTRAISTILYL